ncbi:Probable 2-oxoglutarate dehydrogenase E1 component DHKTD1 homolog, mitochondrial [Strongyloides ratti]|uniref:Probable 2-oxoglutarate dehydrogenase E1 component DHKTD1 homolog, mitochondrial n=1 Tax=Strongyloides ratti TaxID=34506 RepID=A0A090KZX9_STRRB|nr:Probable 2-oxoglutarate dehydrogenase E1 component DHKTD1 homolog, mitochondrial [Strongyloides ratti]CEF63085.1 Probable 2-oxoglutarate dehydrogenase E1 component DHKTD1 homolog, mitochondrial [Strongyloides ratti]
MVKLFVGNLSDKVDSHRLRNLFLEFVNVQECDVLKNFAFVHVSNEEDAQKVIDRFNNYNLEGRVISIERSTSKLRKDPGMGDKCFTCGACDHKTPNCPHDCVNLHGIKRPNTGSDGGSTAKRSNSNSRVVNGLSKSSIVQSLNPAVNDPELALPPNSELKPLYDAYIDARAQYFYFREKYQKEMIRLQQVATTPTLIYDLTGKGTAARKFEPPANLVSTFNPTTNNFTAPPPNFNVPPPTRPLNVPAPGPYGKSSVPVANTAPTFPVINSSSNFTSIPPPINFSVPPPAAGTTPFFPTAAANRKMKLLFSSKQYRNIRKFNITKKCFYNCKNGVFGCLPEKENIIEPLSLPLKTMSPEEAQRLHLINAFRRYGYLKADINPLKVKSETSRDVPELNPRIYGLDPDSEEPINSSTVENAPGISDLVKHLENVYCGKFSIEFMHLQNVNERSFLAQNFEKLQNIELLNEEKVNVLELMLKSQNFDNFLATKFPTLKRYGCEGSESMFGFFYEIFSSSHENDISDIVMCKAHRGRSNLLVELMEFPVVQMFRKIKGKPEFPEDVSGAGDVLSHLTSSFDFKTNDGNNSVHITLLPNPSHLEAVNPVAMGKARGRSNTLRVGEYDYINKNSKVGDSVLCLQVHGDGAFSGQGVVWESLAMSQVPHYRVGGSIHLIVNNQIAFTAESRIGRSTTHASDMAKGIDCPVIHVNGDSPEDVIKAAKLAMLYRMKFRKDIFVNMISFRRWGHNELDNYTITQPVMYDEIENRDSVPDEYCEKLIYQGIYDEEKRNTLLKEHSDYLQQEFKKADTAPPVAKHLEGNWKNFIQAPKAVTIWDTGFDIDHLRFIGAASVKVPETFSIHPHLAKTHVKNRISKMESGENIDWGTAETLAFGSCLAQGFDVRISGQDVGRGTFAHRHAMLVDQKTDEIYIPLNNMTEKQEHFIELANSLLSEEAVLGFEYGYSIENPNRLAIWEAQFGDFFNGAQIIIDTFVASGESKWLTQSGLVMLLPHGFDGAGPEHSSCRMERFLQLCDSKENQNPVDGDNVNMWIVNPTTSAQYFHLLRRQIVTNYRKPMIVVAPKVLLRHPNAASKLEDFAPGTYFKKVIDDNKINDSVKNNVKKVIFTSGKHAFTLMKEREEKNIEDVSIVRVECLCPFPVTELNEIKKKYPNAKKFVWSQEEPRNAGAWSFVSPRFANALGIQLTYAGRKEIAWTATAIAKHHAEEHQDVLDCTFAI